MERGLKNIHTGNTKGAVQDKTTISFQKMHLKMSSADDVFQHIFLKENFCCFRIQAHEYCFQGHFSIEIYFMENIFIHSRNYIWNYLQVLTRWGRVTHVCIIKLGHRWSDDGLLSVRCWAIIWTNDDSRDSKVQGANMGPIWGRQDPGGPHIGPMNLAIWVIAYWTLIRNKLLKN